MNVKLVRATTTDAEDYIRVGKLNLSRFNTLATDPAEVKQKIEGGVVYMIQFQGRSIGFVSYIMKKSNHAYIGDVQVEPVFRNRGIGSYALTVILRELKEIEIVDLLTHPESPAQNLYRRHGFLESGEVIENHKGTGEPRMKMVLARNLMRDVFAQ